MASGLREGHTLAQAVGALLVVQGREAVPVLTKGSGFTSRVVDGAALAAIFCCRWPAPTGAVSSWLLRGLPFSMYWSRPWLSSREWSRMIRHVQGLKPWRLDGAAEETLAGPATAYLPPAALQRVMGALLSRGRSRLDGPAAPQEQVAVEEAGGRRRDWHSKAISGSPPPPPLPRKEAESSLSARHAIVNDLAGPCPPPWRWWEISAAAEPALPPAQEATGRARPSLPGAQQDLDIVALGGLPWAQSNPASSSLGGSGQLLPDHGGMEDIWDTGQQWGSAQLGGVDRRAGVHILHL